MNQYLYYVMQIYKIFYGNKNHCKIILKKSNHFGKS